MGETYQWWWINKIKQNRTINLDNFDIYDLDRPILRDTKLAKNQIIGYERVCRICGDSLKNKNGKYSHHRRYCSKKQCNGDFLYRKFNCQGSSKRYITEVYENQKNEIKKKLKDNNISLDKIRLFILCEKCNKLCTKETYYYSGRFWCSDDLMKFEGINVHHKIPVHTLTEEKIMLIFDWENLIILCKECHNKQDHLLSKTKKLDLNKFRSIEEWI